MRRFIFTLTCLILLLFCFYQLFLPLYNAKEIVVTLGFHPFDICYNNSSLWNFLKISFIFFYTFSSFIIINSLIIRFKIFENTSKTNPAHTISAIQSDSNLKLLIGKNLENNQSIYIPEAGLYQNFLITGTIGTGKTSSAMYPFTEQLIKFNSQNPDKKIGILILDVKGNYFKHVKNLAYKYHLEKDLIEIGLNSHIRYNPLHKPNLNPIVLANRLKTILLLFSENNTESYWLDKAEQIICEAIKLCRLYNNGYVTFLELHKLITNPNYYNEKIQILRNLFINSKFSKSQIYELNACLDFFEKEFFSLDSRTKNILISEITRITNTFISDYDVMSTFCSPKSKLTFNTFNTVLESGKIVVLNINISEYNMLSKIIATYLKLDFQTEIMTRLSKNISKPSAFICDEYDKFASKTDGEFFSLSREAKCINIVSTQSYSSLKSTLKDDSSVKVIIQNLINKIWFRTDDSFTIEDAQKQLRKNRCRKNFKNHIRKCKGDILQLYYAFITIKKFQYFRKYKHLYTTRL